MKSCLWFFLLLVVAIVAITANPLKDEACAARQTKNEDGKNENDKKVGTFIVKLILDPSTEKMDAGIDIVLTGNGFVDLMGRELSDKHLETMLNLNRNGKTVIKVSFPHRQEMTIEQLFGFVSKLEKHRNKKNETSVLIYTKLQ